MTTHSTKPTILIFSTAYLPLVGGAETAIAEITSRLSGTYDFELWCARLRPGLKTRERIGAIMVRRFGAGMQIDKFIFFPLLTFFAMMGRSRTFACIWGMDVSQGAMVGSVLSRLFRIPFVLTVQYGYGSERMSHGRAGAIGISFRFMLRCAAQVTVISHYLAGVVRSYGYRGPLSVIPNGVDVNRIKNKVSSIKDKKEPWVIITTSRLVPKNGIDILIRAAAELRSLIRDTRYVIRIIGSGPEGKKLRNLAHELQVEDVVEFVGDVPYEQIPAELARADIFVRPSRAEGLGTSFLEAMAAGLPVVGTPVGGIPDFLKDPSTHSGQATGLFCNVDDPADLALKIKELIEYEMLRKKIASKGRELVERKFSWDLITQRMREVFQAVLT